MLRLNNVALMRGTRTLYSAASLEARPGERIGLVGPNGCGKSTLFAAVLGELTTEAGEIACPSADRISHVAQRLERSELAALDFVMSGHVPLMQARAHMQQAEGADDMTYSQALAEMAEVNEGAVRARAAEILHGLGFSSDDFSKPTNDFSGGWRNRLALAKALISPSDLLLLDEPTNHLDLDSVIWLENWLQRQPSTVMVISHDREFLDHIAQSIWSIEDGTIARYSGNYSDYETQRAARLAQQEAAARAYDKTSAHLKSYIERFRYKATKARQAQSRIKMLEKLEATEHVKSARAWRFTFPEPEKVPQHLIAVDALSCGYGDKEIVRTKNAVISAGARIGVLGVNGAGKTTLIRTLIGDLPARSGTIRTGQGLLTGYFAQHQLDNLDPELSPLGHLTRLSPQSREQDLRNYLGQFRFSADQATAKTGPMSGGEKARLSLALIAWSRPNLLVLDEPTNHLDMETREALTVALSSFEGAVLLVSHDRHLLNASCDEFWLVNAGELKEFSGDMDDYAELVMSQKRAQALKDEAGSADKTPNKKEQRRTLAQQRARISALTAPLKKKATAAEKRLADIEAQIKAIDEQTAEPDFYNQASSVVAEVLRQRGQLTAEAEELELQWLELTEEIERISAG